jgi:hypothetical protein
MTVGCSSMSPERERDCLIGAGVGALVAGGAIGVHFDFDKANIRPQDAAVTPLSR